MAEHPVPTFCLEHASRLRRSLIFRLPARTETRTSTSFTHRGLDDVSRSPSSRLPSILSNLRDLAADLEANRSMCRIPSTPCNATAVAKRKHTICTGEAAILVRSLGILPGADGNRAGNCLDEVKKCSCRYQAAEHFMVGRGVSCSRSGPGFPNFCF